MNIKTYIVSFICFYLLLFTQDLHSEENSPLAIVKSVEGKVFVLKEDKSESKSLSTFGKLFPNQIVETKEKSKSTLRLFLAQGQLSLYPLTEIKFINLKNKKATKPAIHLELGNIDLNFSEEAGKSYLLNTSNTLIGSKGSRWFASFNKESLTKLVVIKGSIKVYNRPKDMSANVSEGKTCYSDKDGLRIGPSTADDLSLLRQNILEVDFSDPVSDQTKTLEIDYESNF